MAQAAAVRVDAGVVRIRATGFTFIKGQPLARLKNGQSVDFELDLRALARPANTLLAEARTRCIVSYDLWEERFVAAVADAPTRTTPPLSASDAEAWCLDQLRLPLAAFLRRSDPFWVRIEYRVVDDEPADDEPPLSLRGLVDVLGGRRRSPGELRGAFEFGPLQPPR